MDSDKKQHQVEFIPAHKTGYFGEGITVRDAALELGILIDSDCAGIGSCAKCKVEIKKGANAPTPAEQQVLTAQELRKGVRLACQSTIVADSLCAVQTASQLGEQILTDGLFGDVELKPDIRKALVKIPASQLGEKYFDFEKLLECLKHQGITISGYNFQITRDLARVLRANGHTVTVVLEQQRLLAVEPGDTTLILYGVAVDIGTTTVAAKLVDLMSGGVVAVNSAANPQAAHGSDVVSRLQYVIQHPGGLKRFNQLIVKLINGLISNLSDEAGIDREQIYKVVLAGNTVMSHIALNIDPRCLGHKPYTPVFQGPVTLEAQSLEIKIHPGGVVYSIPNLACFVGGDITAVLTILDLDKQSKYQLAIDMGTNGEMVLGSKDRLLCCSSPAGPAWEGACITWGMRATRGAIERVEIGNGGLLFRTIGDCDPTGICGSGLIDIVCGFLRAGAIDKSGRILDPSQLPTGKAQWVKDLIVQKEKKGNDLRIADIGDNNSIFVSQNDIREIQLAKAAIASGVNVLLEEFAIAADEVATVYVAGAFGNHILARDVLDLGLIPDISPEKIKFIGNAALTGAEAILKSRDARERAEQISQKIEYIDIAGQPDFQENFVDAMHFAN